MDKFKSILSFAVVAAITHYASINAQANTVTLTSGRSATLADAQFGYFGSGNATATVVQTHTGGGPWTERGSVEPPGDPGLGTYTDGSLEITVTSGSFGSKVVSGNWTINDPNFWSSYAEGVISMHVGNSRGSASAADHFIWVLTPNKNSGTWSYNGTGFTGGGLSNLKLFSRGIGRNVPDGGITVALLGLGFTGLVAFRRRS